MIPLFLTLKGLYSYQEEQNIDFQPLLEAHLFGIFGAVGSGKSTLLEAISFALYGETERLQKKGDDRHYNMLNLKSNKLLIRFQFSLDTRLTDQFLIEVYGKRHRKKFTQVTPFERRAFRLVKGEWKPIDWKPEEYLHLSYDNFRRTTIIPQGKFQEFLQLTGGKRTEMMKELFQLEQFDLFENTTILFNRNALKKQHVEGQLLEIGEISEDLLTKKEKELKKVESQIRKIERQLTKIEKEEKKWQHLKELSEKINQVSQKLTKLRNQEGEMLQKEKELKEYELCRSHFFSKSEQLDELGKKNSTRKKELEELQEQIDTLAQELLEVQNLHKEISKEYEARETLRQKAEELEEIVHLKKLQQEITRCEEEIARLQKEQQALDSSLSKTKKQAKQLNEEKRKLQKALPDRQFLLDIQQWFNKMHQLDNELISLQEQLEGIQEDIREKLKELEQLLDTSELDEWIPPLEKVRPISEIIGVLTQTEKLLHEQLQTIEKEIQHFHLQSELERFAKELKPGEPCPLCGSLEHPQKLQPGEAAESYQTKQIEKEVLSQKVKLIGKILTELRILEKELAALQKPASQIQQKINKAKKAMEKHRKTFHWEGYSPDDLQTVEKLLQSAAEQDEKVKEVQSQIDSLQEETEQLQDQLQSLLKELGDSQQQFTTFSTTFKTTKQKLKLLTYEAYQDSDESELSSLIQELNKTYVALEKEFRESEEKIKRLTSLLDTKSGHFESLQKSHRELEQEIEDLREQIAKEVEASPFETLEDIRMILSRKLDMDAERMALEEFKKEKHHLETQLNQLQETYQEQYDPEAHQKVKDTIIQLQEEQKRLMQEKGGLEREISQFKENLNKKQNLEKELQSLKEREENLKILQSLFRGSGFVNYVSSVFLEDLCHAANERFQKLTRHRLRLEINEKNEFQVRDFLNDGQLRSVKTLSGGQTFQASLSLALALSDSIRHRSNVSSNFFFLDEGFGTLDKESLEIVFETLKSLRQEKRIVGIISHVDELQEQIDRYLWIFNDEKRGSIIYRSWEREG
ncbi:MAG: SMC family ATPase [Calditrichaeota bacterium]|nr:MAG: SMC family ATPase [Calditrichota bacterium]